MLPNCAFLEMLKNRKLSSYFFKFAPPLLKLQMLTKFLIINFLVWMCLGSPSEECWAPDGFGTALPDSKCIWQGLPALEGAQLTTHNTAAFMSGRAETEGGTSHTESSPHFNVS